jgi:maltose-binding protein MalE
MPRVTRPCPAARSRRPAPLLVALVALAAIALLLGGCGGGSRSAGTIVIWEQMDPEERMRFERNLAKFQASHPGVEIQHLPYETEQLRTQFQTAAAAGGGPALIFGPSDQVGPLSLLQLIQPLDQALPAGFFDRFIPQAIDTLEGHIWAAPDQVGNHLVLCYNRALVPTPPTTAAEFIAIAKALTAPAAGGKPARYGFAINTTEPFWLIPFLTGFGGWVMDEQRNPTLDTPAMVSALQFLKDLREKHRIMPRESDYQVAETLFKEGQAAMIVNGPWSWSGYRKAGIDLGIAPIFRMPSGEWAHPMAASKGYSINVNVKQEQMPMVIELLTFLTSAEAQKEGAVELGVLPSHREAYSDSAIAGDPLLRDSQRAFELGRRMPVVPEMRIMWDTMRPGLQNVMNGVQSPAEAAKEMQERSVRQLADMKR